MKKLLGMIAVLFSLFCLSACANNGTGNSQNQIYGEIKAGVETNHTK